MLCDLGQGKILDRGVSSTLGVPYGPILYRPPEVKKGKPYTAESDIYCFGCLIYVLVERVLSSSGSTKVPLKLWGLYEGCAHNCPSERPKILTVVYKINALRDDLKEGTMQMVDIMDLATHRQEELSNVHERFSSFNIDVSDI